MDYIELNEYFNKKIADFRTETKRVPELNDCDELYNYSRKLFYDEYTSVFSEFYFQDHFLHLNKTVSKELFFCPTDTDKINHIKKWFENSKEWFVHNSFTNYFTEDLLHEEMFSIQTMDIVFHNIFIRNQEKFKLNFESTSPQPFSKVVERAYLKLADCLILWMQAKYYFSKLDEISGENHKKAKKNTLTINQIALKCVYGGYQVTRSNCETTIRKYGLESGEKLFQRFTYYSSTTNRKGKPNPCTPKKLNNKIDLLESIIPLLPTEKQGRVKDEVSLLKTIQETEYL